MFELNWMEGVAWRNSQRFNTNKAGHRFEQKHLEAEFGQSNFSDPRFGEKTDVEFVSTQHQIFFCPISSSY
jgi:hypothetical protein